MLREKTYYKFIVMTPQGSVEVEAYDPQDARNQVIQLYPNRRIMGCTRKNYV